MLSQGWDIKDRFRNTSRDKMPEDETITSFGDRLIALAQHNIAEHGGAKSTAGGKSVYRIAVEKPANVERLSDPKRVYSDLRSRLMDQIEKGITSGATDQDKARAAYLAICLDFAPELKQRYAEQWSQAVIALNGFTKVLQVIFYESPIPAGEALATKAIAAGIRKPANRVKIWV